MPRDPYQQAGVDIEAGAELVRRIRDAAESTRRPELIGGLGGFASLFALRGWRDPVLVSGTDGVGTKLLVACRAGVHDTVGIDLVAMCVNDIVTCGAEPLFFLDYLATGRLDPAAAARVVEGIAAGCRLAGCALAGGETAEMPGLYGAGHYDLAGFAVGAVERDRLIDGSGIRAGDLLVGIPSSGLHSNGYSLVRRLVDGLDWGAEHGLGRPLAEVLLEPTRIYVREAMAVSGFAHGMVHVTGGGFYDNLPRVLPPGLGARVRAGSWEVPPIFRLLERLGGLDRRSLHRTFNMGIGMVVVTAARDAGRVPGGTVIGQVTAQNPGAVVIE